MLLVLKRIGIVIALLCAAILIACGANLLSASLDDDSTMFTNSEEPIPEEIPASLLGTADYY